MTEVQDVWMKMGVVISSMLFVGGFLVSLGASFAKWTNYKNETKYLNEGKWWDAQRWFHLKVTKPIAIVIGIVVTAVFLNMIGYAWALFINQYTTPFPFVVFCNMRMWKLFLVLPAFYALGKVYMRSRNEHLNLIKLKEKANVNCSC